MHWSVTTPMYMTYGSMWDDEPPEYGCDWICVEANTKREAKLIAVREWRKQNTHWMQDCRSDNASPFTGLKVENTLCKHGFCFCDLQYCIQPNPDWILLDTCPECDKEWEQLEIAQNNPEHEF